MKLTIVIGAFYFIYRKTIHTTISLLDFTTQLKQIFSNNYKTLLILLSFTFFNWFFEILKWKTLACSIKKITFLQATKQSLGSLTASLLTPNRIGEYAIKSFYYRKKNRKKIVLLNLISNISQMAVTVLFGVCGLVFVILNFEVNLPIIRSRKLVYYTAILCIAVFSIRFFISKKTREFYLSKIIFFSKNLTRILVFKTLFFSVIRYLIFSHQFYFLLWLFGIETDYYTLILLVFSTYLIASVIPSLPMFDWLIKGSVAVFIFDLIGVNELIIVSITTIMWLLNFALPAIMGSYFVLNFKLVKNTDIT